VLDAELQCLALGERRAHRDGLEARCRQIAAEREAAASIVSPRISPSHAVPDFGGRSDRPNSKSRITFGNRSVHPGDNARRKLGS
jgi:hypothetical protein